MPIPFRIVVDEDRIIRGDLFLSSKNASGTLIICHGYKGFKDWGMFPYLGEKFSEELDVITFNFSHNGVGEELTEFTEPEKFAKNTYSRELEDLHTVVEAVKKGEIPTERKSNPRRIFLLGHSRGGGVCLIYAFDHPRDIHGVISWNGITDVDIFTDEQKEAMRKEGRAYVLNARTQQKLPLDAEILEDMEQNKDRFNILQRVKEAQVPIVLIQGTEDGERLRKGSEMLVKNNPNIPWILVEKGNHTFGAVHPFRGTTGPLEEAIRHSKAFIARFL